MGTKELEKLLETVRAWIISADQKISIGLVLEAATVSIIAKPTFDLLTRGDSKPSILALALLVGSVILLMYGLTKLLMAVSPRTSLGPKKSHIYFGSIAQLSNKDFRKKIKALSAVNYKDELIDQIHITSKISKKKHSHYKDAVGLFLAGLVVWLLFVVEVARLTHG